jgi:hypothetical protein
MGAVAQSPKRSEQSIYAEQSGHTIDTTCQHACTEAMSHMESNMESREITAR